MDFLKLRTFEVEEAKGPVNYKLKLPKGIKIYPIFHVSLLEPVDPGAPLDKIIELDDERSEREYDVEIILDHAVTGR